MKLFLVSLSLFTTLHFSGISQEAQPQLLTIPENWSFEFIAFPLDFAADLDYKGFEELRFSPGMFDTTSNRYFTYLFAAELEGKHSFSIPETKKFIKQYYQGLSHAVAQSKETSVDTSKIKVIIQKAKVKTGIHDAYFITVNFVDSFTNNQEVLLNIELVVLHAKSDQNTYLVAAVSPQPKYSEVWKELYSYRKALMQGNPRLKMASGK